MLSQPLFVRRLEKTVLSVRREVYVDIFSLLLKTLQPNNSGDCLFLFVCFIFFIKRAAPERRDFPKKECNFPPLTPGFRWKEMSG